MSEGWQGWDQYAPFYDWENARTVGRRDVGFWRRLAAQHSGPILELGCGTGRIAIPILKAGAALVGVDRSDAMLARARVRARRASLGHRRRSCGRISARCRFARAHSIS
jgi:ubiquinone/menaquinone biosynthesis C-methylase UbiE